MPADLWGHELPAVRTYRKRKLFQTEELESKLPGDLPSVVRRRVAATIATYRTSGLLSAKELGTIEGLWLKGMSLSELARREGVHPQTINRRVKRLRIRAPLFFRWWQMKKRSRTRR